MGGWSARDDWNSDLPHFLRHQPRVGGLGSTATYPNDRVRPEAGVGEPISASIDLRAVSLASGGRTHTVTLRFNPPSGSLRIRAADTVWHPSVRPAHERGRSGSLRGVLLNTSAVTSGLRTPPSLFVAAFLNAAREKLPLWTLWHLRAIFPYDL
jgi:hypothetical protein